MGENNNEAKAPKTSWTEGLSAEFKKIIWPTKETVAKQTGLVVALSLILGALISVIDVLVQYGVKFLIK